MYYIHVLTHNTKELFHSVSKRSKIRSAFPKERIHFAFLQFRKGRRNRLEITLRRDVFFNSGYNFFHPSIQGFILSLFPPFKALVSLTIQILIQLPSPQPPSPLPTATHLSRVFFFSLPAILFFFL